jgi:hypothetical protein
MQLSTVQFPIALGLLFSALALPARAQGVQNPMPALRPLHGLEWRLPKTFASLSGDRLVIDIPADAGPADACATARLPLALLSGAGGFAMEIEAEGLGITPSPKRHLGLKFQLHWRDGATGREGYPNCPNETGDFARKTLLNEVDFSGAHPDKVTLMLGLQGVTGRVAFDLSTLRAAPTQGLFRRVNEDYIVRYPDDKCSQMTSVHKSQLNTNHNLSLQFVNHEDLSFVDNQPHRGCMLPGRATTEDDIETLHRWGATMARFQMSRRSENTNLVEYAAWVDSRLDNLEDVLRWAAARGMKICIDLHAAPGGCDASGGQALFRDERYARAFVETWCRIAARFRGHPAIYGYDLMNEPLQNGRATFDYWTIQRLVAEAVREIDPVTPIIVEANHWALPDAFSYLSPLQMDNVIYQVHFYDPHDFTHQGVGGRPIGPKWPDPEKNWTRDRLREILRPVREFEARHHAKIYVGEFSAAAGAEGAETYLRDCMALFNEYGWDWTYHAFREWEWWSVEHEGPDPKHMLPAIADTPRKRALLEGLSK